MTLDFLSRYWALVIASVLFTAITLFVLFRLYTESAKGQLGARIRDLQTRYREHDKAERAATRAERKLAKLSSKSASVKPRHLEEARGALEDARALQKIAADQVLIAENHVRKVIVEEYPPKRQEALRIEYLRSEEGHRKPFSF